jgi:hypothetical protein
MLLLLSASSMWLLAPAAFAADETCARCGQEVSVSGEFAHSKYDASLTIEGAGNDAAAFHEEIYGERFTVTIAHLPAGKYTISIGEAETWSSAPGQRVFSVNSGDTRWRRISTSSPPPVVRGKFVTSRAWSSMRTIRLKGR